MIHTAVWKRAESDIKHHVHQLIALKPLPTYCSPLNEAREKYFCWALAAIYMIYVWSALLYLFPNETEAMQKC